MGGFPNATQDRLKTHACSGKVNKATRPHCETDRGKQELSPDDFIPQGSATDQGRLVGKEKLWRFHGELERKLAELNNKNNIFLIRFPSTVP